MRSGFPKVKIEMQAGGRGHVWLNGVEVPGVMKVSFTASSREMTAVTFSMYADVEVVADEADVRMDITDPTPPEPLKRW